MPKAEPAYPPDEQGTSPFDALAPCGCWKAELAGRRLTKPVLLVGGVFALRGAMPGFDRPDFKARGRDQQPLG
jgi:hypothetical protein